jgi:hypothetical protein
MEYVKLIQNLQFFKEPEYIFSSSEEHFTEI